mmetsp:Transcript_18057/g.51359  ORF Transcript_18057/g.51359 Transcript_18057/m.51359 type:complete len:230 (+) Transcript_18057:1662-2351(+)
MMFSLFAWSSYTPSFKHCENDSWNVLYFFGSLASSANIAKQFFCKLVLMWFKMAFCCSCSLLMFNGMSSLSTMPFMKPIHLGRRSLNSLMNTRLTYKRMLKRWAILPMSNMSLGAVLGQYSKALNTTCPLVMTCLTPRWSSQSVASHLYKSAYSSCVTSSGCRIQTGLFLFINSHWYDTVTTFSSLSGTSSSFRCSIKSSMGKPTKAECFRMRSRNRSLSKNSYWSSFK